MIGGVKMNEVCSLMIYSFVSANSLNTPCNESPFHSAQPLVGVLVYLNQVLSTSFYGCTTPALCTVTSRKKTPCNRRWKAGEQEGECTSCLGSSRHRILCSKSGVECGQGEGEVSLEPFIESAIEVTFRGAVKAIWWGVFEGNHA